MSNQNLNEAQLLEKYRVSLENVVKQPEIAEAMAELGYDVVEITKGKALLQQTRQTFSLNEQEDDETSQAYTDFTTKRKELSDIYKVHRKKGKVVFLNDSETLKQLELSGSQPYAYVKWLDMIRKFYTVANSNQEIQKRLKRLKVTPQELLNGNNLVTQLEQARADYLREKGESQDATKLKDSAFAKMDDYMREFYAVAKIALEDRPQLLESLSVFVRS